MAAADGSTPYLHGTSRREQQRLIEQASLLGGLLDANLTLRAGERLLEIGCGVGAVLARIARREPDARLCGIDISDAQIAAARIHLREQGIGGVELVVGDGAALPWPDQSFDRVRLVWVVEHLSDPLAVLCEARRVLRPGGTIHLTETDYASLRVSPPDGAISAFLQAFLDHFNRHGDAHAGPRLGPLLEEAGFSGVDNRMQGVHLWCPSRRTQLERFITYLLGFMTPELPALLAAAGSSAEAERITEGHRRFERLAERFDGSLSISVYQAIGSAVG